MGRLVSTALAVAAAAVLAVGCGGDDDSGGALESALAYIPKDTPFAVAIDTDVDGGQFKSVEAIVDRFPGGFSFEDWLGQQLEQSDERISYEDDVKPLLGNPFVVSAADVRSFLSDSDEDDFVGALQVEDTDALDGLIDKTDPDERGEVAGATLYEDGGTYFAVEDDVVVFGASRELLETALERADGDDHLDQSAFEESLEGLPKQALARTYVDLQTLIGQDPGAATARKIEWVAALRTMGITLSAEDDSVDVEFNLRTGGDLSDEDLPLATGDEAPEVVQEAGEIGFGLRDPSQLVTFFESAFQASDPQSFGDYEAGKQVLARQLDLDLDEDVFAQLTRNLSVSVAADGAFAARAEVEDPDAFTETVDKLGEALPQVGSGFGVTDVRRRGDLYEARLADGGSFVFGVSDGVLVVGSDVARTRRIASQEPDAVEGASGSLVMTADAERLARQVLEFFRPLGATGALGGALLARPLDDLTGSVATSTAGMKGKLSLSLD